MSRSRHTYKKWSKDADGSRVAHFSSRIGADLVSTWIQNANGTRVLRYIVLDIDFKLTHDLWKDGNCVSWQKIQSFLSQNFPDILRQVEYAVTSTSGTGIHLFIGLAALPLCDETQVAQQLARRTQGLLIQLFQFLGIGADAAAFGLERDACSFRNKEKLLHHNRILTQKIEKSAKSIHRIPFLTMIHRSLERSCKELGITTPWRFYPHSKVEAGLAKLWLYGMGLYNRLATDVQALFATGRVSDREVFKSIAAHEQFELSTRELCQLTGLSEDFVRTRLTSEEISRWLISEKTISNTWKLAVKSSAHFEKMFKRAELLLKGKVATRSNFIANLIHPSDVQDGTRNTAVVSWALALKWNGYGESEALSRVLHLSTFIPHASESRTVRAKQIKATVSSVYRNRRELYGRGKSELPGWLLEDIKSAPKKSGQIPSRRSPGACVALRMISKEEEIESSRKLEDHQTAAKETISRLSTHNVDNLHASIKEAQAEREFEHNALVSSKRKLYAVFHSQRIGIFNGEKLIICLTRSRHYSALLAAKHLQKQLGIETVTVRKLRVGSEIKNSREQIENCTPISSEAFCGRQESRLEAIKKWKEHKNRSRPSEKDLSTDLT
jgi:hypothetical protein